MSVTRAGKERDATQRRSDAKRLMELPEFQRLAYWLLFQLAPVDGPTYAGEHTHQTAYNEGRRSYAIDVGRLLRGAHLHAFQKLEREALADTLQGRPDSSR